MTGLVRTLRLRTPLGVPYAIMEGFPTYSFDEEGATAKEEYLIRAIDMLRFRQESLPAPIVFRGLVTLPRRRRMPGTSILVTKQVDFRPHTGDQPADPLLTDTIAAANTYDPHMIAEITYGTLEQGDEDNDDKDRDPDKPETFLEHRVNVGASFLALNPNKQDTADKSIEGGPFFPCTDPDTGERFLTDEEGLASCSPVTDRDGNPVKLEDNKDALMQIIKTIPIIEHSFLWKFVVEPNWLTIYRMLGRVNKLKYKFLEDAEEETCLFIGVSGQQKFLFKDKDTIIEPWSLDFRFQQKRVEEKVGLEGKDEDGNFVDIATEVYGHNHVWSPNKQRWVRSYRDGARPLYEFDTDVVVDIDNDTSKKGFEALFTGVVNPLTEKLDPFDLFED